MAYLYGPINNYEILLRIPQGLKIDSSQHVCQLQKAIYGLRISSKSWHGKLDADILAIGLQ